MEAPAYEKYNMLVTAGAPGEYQVKLVFHEGGMFRILLKVKSPGIPSVEWLISCYEKTCSLKALS